MGNLVIKNLPWVAKEISFKGWLGTARTVAEPVLFSLHFSCGEQNG
jgi:hypothetical protein